MWQAPPTRFTDHTHICLYKNKSTQYLDIQLKKTVHFEHNLNNKITKQLFLVLKASAAVRFHYKIRIIIYYNRSYKCGSLKVGRRGSQE